VRHAQAHATVPISGPEGEGAGLAKLAEGVFRRYGYDLRHFAGAHLRRRLDAAMRGEGADSLEGFRDLLLRRPELMERLLISLCGAPRPAYGEAGFHRCLRRDIVPVLRTYPFIRVWVPGCGSGSAAYALAAILDEEGLGGRFRIYATDLSAESVRRAKEGKYPMTAMRRWAAAHAEGGGKAPLYHHMETSGASAAFLPALRKHMVFAQHNLATDGSFNEFNLILCRNALSVLEPETRDRARGLIHQSLAMFGYLALGGREAPGGEDSRSRYQLVDAAHRIYRKVG
jgi:chemotaxis protein methyltransferase CheR